VELPPPIAGLLLAGLVSDTLNLTSPTTTPRDREILGRLETIAGVNAREFTDKLFASGSVLTLKPAWQAITIDCKEYSEKGDTFSVAQIEEVGFDQFWKRKEELQVALEEYARNRKYLFSTLLVTDVVLQNSLMLVAGSKAYINQIDYPPTAPGVFKLRDVVSRKKQLLPYLTHCLHKMKAAGN
jgi:manganese-dependent inorganic pyrophosphatase